MTTKWEDLKHRTDDAKKLVDENRGLIEKIGDKMEKSKLPFFRKLVGFFRD